MSRPTDDDRKVSRTMEPGDPSMDPRKDPDEWVTGDEPMTVPQRSYLQTLAREAGETVDDSLDKAEASKKIDELQRRTGRGVDRP